MTEPIAIIGIGLRVSGANNPATFVEMLRQGVRRVGRLDDVYSADWRALGIPPRELRQVDPQHRLLLEVATEALEDAGLTRVGLSQNRTAVVCGLIWDDYLRQLERDGDTDGYSVLGNVGSFAANRISFRFDLKGPSLVVNAACASGLVAIHEACRIIHSGEADLAIAGACELMLSPESDRMMQRLGVISPTGRCLPLDARADGFVRGDGAGVVILKPLSKVETHERVYAVVAGSAVNHNGRNEWIMASSAPALRAVIGGACSDAGISPSDLSYVEMHGSGGPKGDVVEASALPSECRVGSVKSNLGHLGAAAGIISLIKVTLGLEAGQWLPTILELPHPDIRQPVVRDAESWTGLPYAGVTATALSGTNAHVVLRAVEPPAQCHESVPAGTYDVPVSAHTPAALEQRTRELKRWAEGREPADIAFTCTHGRDVLAHSTTVQIGSGPAAEVPAKGRIVSLPLFPWQRERFGMKTKAAGPGLQSAIQALLELPEPPSVHTPFFELGLNSMAITTLSQKFGIPATAFFEYPTIAKLTAAIPVSTTVAPIPAKASESGTAIAIVGMACRFPGGADTPECFWNLLREGRDAFGPVPAGRNVPIIRGAFLDQIDGFDASFFRMSPREAAQTDPQQRLFLEVVWEALENAGLDATRLDGSRTGVYAGAFANDYAKLNGPVDAYHFSGLDIAFNANRVSFALGLQGPSLTVDTACSSSLVALHLATRALRQGECDMALAGGVSLMLTPEISEFLQNSGTLSPTGVCRAFDVDADGMVRGEGCGVVILKRVSDAEANGDRILAVIRGTAMNHGGSSGGLTVPSPSAQADLYRSALKDAGVSAAEIAYVEAHGTGTRLGDPIELSSLSQVYSSPLRIGTVKTNIGHTDAAAGIAGLIKGVLMLQHREIPASLQFASPTPEFDWKSHPFVVPKVCESLEGDKLAVSSFGLGGTNAHVILESYHPADSATVEMPTALLPLSAKAPEALEDLLRSIGEVNPDICWTAARSRTGMRYRAAVVAGKAGPIREVLERSDWRTAFVFPGQGGQWAGMGRDLIARNKVFAAKVEEIDARLQRLGASKPLDFDVLSLDETAIVQPSIFALQVGLAAVWQSMGFTPDLVIGHSMGEIAAAHIAGHLDLADAVKVVYERSRILAGASGEGGMLAVALSPQEAEELIAPYSDVVSVGVINGPRSVVLSGAIDLVTGELEERGIFYRQLHVRYPSHCPQMDRFQDSVREALKGIQPRDGAIQFHSTVLGRIARGSELDADYWARNFRAPVLFAQAVSHCGASTFIELSPHPTLDTAIASCLEQAGSNGLSVTSLRRNEPEQETLLEAVGQLWSAGYPVDLTKVVPRARIVDLPNYPWQRKRHWISASRPESVLRRIESPLPQEQYQKIVTREDFGGHQLRNEVYFPAAAMLEMALAAGRHAIRDVTFESPLVLDYQPTRLQLTIDGDAFSIHSSRDARNWERHAAGFCGGHADPGFQTGAVKAVDGFYEELELRGYGYDGPFRAVTKIERGADCAVAVIAAPNGMDAAALDACLHSALALAPGGLLVPVSLGVFESIRPADGDLRALIDCRDSTFNIEIHDNSGPVARVRNLKLSAITTDRGWCFRTRWIPAMPSVELLRGHQRFQIVGRAPELTQFLKSRGHVCTDDAPDNVLFVAEGDDFERIYGASLRLAQSLEMVRPAPRLWLITRGAQALNNEPVSHGQAGLWGLGRVIARELPFLGCTAVDLDPESDDRAQLWRELASNRDEPQVMFRQGKRYVLRAERVRFATGRRSFRIGVDAYGQLDGLKTRPFAIPRPAAGQVVIRTETVPLNFRDALNALGMLPEYAAELGIGSAMEMPFGFECSGIIETVGDGVTALKAGDRVIAGPTTGALASHVVVDSSRVIRAPKELGCLPVVYMTASYALEILAQLKPRERVLIHAATGGVGMAAVQIAQRIDAEIYATAHPDKWAALRTMGVTNIMSSRDDAFAAWNVDVVLNSLSGPLIEASLRACAPGARFIEIGKKDIWPAARVAALRPDIGYHAFTFSEIADARPELVPHLLRQMIERPVKMPVTRFSAEEIPAAFRFLAQARHTGKVVIEMPREGGIRVQPGATYWITGGRGALGREVAQWLVERGATRVILSGRTPARSKHGAIEYRQCDVSSLDQVRKLVESEQIRGIIHAAGVIDDATIAAQTPERLRRVYAPKGIAVQNIVAATQGIDLDFFILFSSTAAVLGPPGQANYAAANAAMDAMAHNAGALSIQWGPWADAGLAASLSEGNRQRLATRGMDFMDPRECLAAMDALAASGLRVAAVAPINWTQYVGSLPPGCPASLFERLTHARGTAPRNILSELEATPAQGRRAVLDGFVNEQIARSLGLADASGIGPRQRLFDLGFDSLMAVELRNRLESALKQPLRRTLIFDFPRVEALSDHLAELLEITEDRPEQDLAAMLDDRLAAVSQYLGQEL